MPVEPNEPTASVAATGDSGGKKPGPQAEAKGGSKSAAKPSPRKTGAQFGDASVSHSAIDPVVGKQRTDAPSSQFLRVGAALLHPFSLALVSAASFATVSPKSALLSSLLGFLLAAVVNAALASAMQRYGISPGVLSRHVFGTRGSRAFALLRALVGVSLLGFCSVSAASVLYYGLLCGFPGLAATANKLPSLAGLELGVLLLSVPLLWLASRVPPRLWFSTMWAAPLALVVFFFVADVATPLEWLRSSGALALNGGATALVFVGAFCLFSVSSERVRYQATTAPSVLAPFVWLAPWLLAAAAFAAMGSSLPTSLVADPAHALCARLPRGPGLSVAGLWALAWVWPLGSMLMEQASLGIEEASSSTTPIKMKVLARRLLLGSGVALALLCRTAFGDFIVLSLGLCVAVFVALAVFVAVDYLVVRRGRTVLDDLYATDGPLNGFAGVLPAGLVAWLIASISAFAFRSRGLSGSEAYVAATSLGCAVVVGFGTVARMRQKRVGR